MKTTKTAQKWPEEPVKRAQGVDLASKFPRSWSDGVSVGKSPINRGPQRFCVRSSMGQSQVRPMEAPLWIRHVLWLVDEFIRNISDYF